MTRTTGSRSQSWSHGSTISLYICPVWGSMGSCLGPTLEDFYIFNLENKIFKSQQNLTRKIYCRYVDDIFVLAKHIYQVPNLRHALISNSASNFTVSDKFIHTPSFFLYSLHNLKTIIAMDLKVLPNGKHVVVEIRANFRPKFYFQER